MKLVWFLLVALSAWLMLMAPVTTAEFTGLMQPNTTTIHQPIELMQRRPPPPRRPPPRRPPPPPPRRPPPPPPRRPPPPPPRRPPPPPLRRPPPPPPRRPPPPPPRRPPPPPPRRPPPPPLRRPPPPPPRRPPPPLIRRPPPPPPRRPPPPPPRRPPPPPPRRPPPPPPCRPPPPPPRRPPPTPPPPSYDTIQFDIGGAIESSYSTFIASLRDYLKGHETYFDLPVLEYPVVLPPDFVVPRYLYVELITHDNNSITFAINRDNITVVGYSDTYEGLVRARFFDDAPEYAKQNLFPEAEGHFRTENIGYSSDYGSLEATAGLSPGGRREFGLGLQMLQAHIDEVSHKDVGDVDFRKHEAELFLIAIQTVSEATRFKYIEDMINHHLDVYNFPLDFKVLDLENNWETISTAIITANQLTGQFNRPLLLVNADGTNRVIWNVAQVGNDVGLLNYFYWRRSSNDTDEWPMKLKQVVDDVDALA